MTSKLELIALNILQEELDKNKHTALKEDELINKLVKITGEEKEVLLKALEDSEIITTRVTSNDEIMRAALKEYTLENHAAANIDRLQKAFSKKQGHKKIDHNDLKMQRGVKLSEEQLEAINTSLSKGVSVITGGPGTGKTTMVLGLVRAIKSLNLNVTLCAPTGKAAKRLGEATGLQKFNPSTVHRYLVNLNSFDVLIVDEASMLDIGLFQMVLETIPDGKQLVLIGDKDQLPPVGSGQPFKDIIEFLGWHNDPTGVTGQSTVDGNVKGIISAAYAIKSGRLPDSNFSLDSDNFEFIECEEENICDRVLEYYFETLPKLLKKDFDEIKDELQILSPQRKGTVGVTTLNKEIQNRVTRKGQHLYKREGKDGLELFLRDRVIQTKNSNEPPVMNGEVGNVLSSNETGLKVLFNKQEFVFDQDSAEDLDLAYCLTVHKSQGSEYAGVIIPVTSEHDFMLERDLIYTAVTRGKKKVCLIGNKDTFKNALKKRKYRYTGFKLELDKKTSSKEIGFSRLTQIFRQAL